MVKRLALNIPKDAQFKPPRSQFLCWLKLKEVNYRIVKDQQERGVEQKRS
jgi:hypothetical protein